MQQPRLNYILQLRGVAALTVVVYHHCHFFWINQNFCGELTNNQPTTQTPQIAEFLEAAPINLGDFGVATFFLISGFLMPLVAKQKTRLQFITRRIKRIYPPYIAALLFVLLLGYLHSHYHAKAFPWCYDHIIASFLLIRDIGQYPFIDGIVWTLEIELKFYLLCMLALPWLSKQPVKFIGLIIVLSALSLVAASSKPLIHWQHGVYLLTLSSKAMQFMSFMCIGCLLSYFYQKQLSPTEAIIAGLMLAVLYICHSIDRNTSHQEIISYTLAFVLFIGCYLARQRFTNKGLLAHTGKISYSLYLVHGVPGFFILYALLAYGVGLAITVALAYSIVAAFIFYWLAEHPLLKKSLRKK